MKKIYCDCCGDQFEYGRETAKTNGKDHTAYMNQINDTRRLSVSITIKFGGGIGVDICAKCRREAIMDILNTHPLIAPEL